jgi:hypothetical protein
MLLESLLAIVLAGSGWQGPGQGLMEASAIAVGSDGTLYAIGPNGLPEPAIFRSVDGGEFWDQVAAFPTRDFLVQILADPLAPNRLFLVDEHFFPPSTLIFGGLYRSLDRGQTWTSQLDLFGSILSVAFDPSRPNLLYVALGPTVRRSNDGGDSFLSLTVPFLGEQLRVAPSGEVFAFTDDALFRSQNAAASWSSLAAPAPRCGVFTELVIDPTDSDRMFLGAGKIDTDSCGEVFRTLDGGQTWTSTATFDAPVTELVIDALHPSLVYANVAVLQFPITGRVLVSGDEGEHWRDLELPATGASQIALAPDGGRLYAATPAGVYARDFRQTKTLHPRDPR